MATAIHLNVASRIPLKEAVKEGDDPVGETTLVAVNRVGRTGNSDRIRERRPPKPKYVRRPIVNQYCEGKLKRSPEGL